MRLRKSDIYFLWHKAATTVAYVGMLWLTVRFCFGHLDWQFATSCAVLSAFWCLLVVLKLHNFLQTYCDVFSRLEILVPITFGMVLSCAGLLSPTRYYTHIASAAELVLWFSVFSKYRENKRHFAQLGHGPVPKGTWISPPESELSPGDLVLTNGAVAARLHESVGHAFLVLSRDNELVALSSHMDRGCTVDPIASAIGEIKGGYIVLKLSRPFTAAQNAHALELAEDMVRRNRAWKSQRTRHYHEFVDSVFSTLPRTRTLQALHSRVRSAYKCTGYDWLGMLMGRLAPNDWTCIGAALELYHKVGVHTRPYGTGILGFGTTLFDPIMPVRFLHDPAFRLLRERNAPLKQGTNLIASS